MQTAALQALGLDGEYAYEAIAVAPEAFAETVGGLPGDGFAGVNVTIPHKEAGLAPPPHGPEAARGRGGATPLPSPAGGATRADNTDAPGLLDALGEPAPRTALV